MVNDLLDHDALAVYGEPFTTLGFRFVSASYDAATRQIHVALENGLQISFARERLRAPVLSSASDEDLGLIEVTATVVYFPRIDEGFSLEPLAFGDFGNRPWDNTFVSEIRNDQAKRLTAA